MKKAKKKSPLALKREALESISWFLRNCAYCDTTAEQAFALSRAAGLTHEAMQLVALAESSMRLK
jgi:hypothetical protein